MLVTDEVLAGVVAHARTGPFYARHLEGYACRTRAEFQDLPLSSAEDLGAEGRGALRLLDHPVDDIATAAEFLRGFLPENDFRPLLEALWSSPVLASETLTGSRAVPNLETRFWSSEAVVDVLTDLRAWAPEIVAGDARLLVLLSEVAETTGQLLPSSVEHLVVIGLLAPAQRSRLEEFWGAGVVELYQSPEESIAVGISCPEGSLHLANDFYLCEVLDPDTRKAVPPGGRGVLVVTSLRPSSRPLVRWSTGDLVEMSADVCKCERPDFPVRRVGCLQTSVMLGGRRVPQGQILAAAQKFAAALESRVFHMAARDGDLRLVVEVQDPKKALPIPEHLALRRQVGLPMSVGLTTSAPISGTLSLADLARESACQLLSLAEWQDRAVAARSMSGISLSHLLTGAGRRRFREQRQRNARLRSLFSQMASDGS